MGGTTIMVSGLNANVRKTDLQGAFGEFGEIIRLDLSGAKAYLEFDDKNDARDAVKCMDGHILKECRMRVEIKESMETPRERQNREGREALRAQRGSVNDNLRDDKVRS